MTRSRSTGPLTEIWSAPIGIAAKFTVAATDDGHVYVGTRSNGTSATAGVVYGFGVTSNPPFTGTGQVTLPDAGVGGASSAASVTLTATQAMQVSQCPRHHVDDLAVAVQRGHRDPERAGHRQLPGGPQGG